jgi:hypothetical protein
MSDYFHEETVKELEQEILLLKAQLDELLAAAKAVMQMLDKGWDFPEDRPEAKRLEAAIAKSEGRAS